MTCQIYTMPHRRPAPIRKAVEHPHQGAFGRGGDTHQRGGGPTMGDVTHFQGVECIHRKWGLFE